MTQPGCLLSDSPFAGPVTKFAAYKCALGYTFGETSCYRLRDMDRLFGKIGSDGSSIFSTVKDATCATPSHCRALAWGTRAWWRQSITCAFPTDVR